MKNCVMFRSLLLQVDCGCNGRGLLLICAKRRLLWWLSRIEETVSNVNGRGGSMFICVVVVATIAFAENAKQENKIRNSPLWVCLVGVSNDC